MRRALALIACLGGVVPALVAQAPSRDNSQPSGQTATATIRGRVLIAGSDIPVRKARVTLAPDAGALVDPAYADNDGWFAFTDLTPRRYIISAWKSGFVETRFGARNFWDRHVSIVAGAGQALDGVTLTLEKGAAIAGRVIDELGEPLVGMPVAVGRITAVDGRPRLETSNFTTETDDLGEYRVGGLPAGTFAVAAYGWPAAPSRTTFTTPDGNTLTTMSRRPRTVFHPAAPLLTQARPVTLKRGEEAGAVDITFRSDVPAARISGRILDPFARGGFFSLAIASDGGGIPDAALTMNTSVTPDGEFSMVVAPSEYTLVAQNETGVAIQHVTVGESDISGIQLTLVKGARITGRVVFEGLPPPASARVFVQASSPEAVEGVAMMRAVAARTQSVLSRPDGTFSLTGVVGRREITVNAQSIPGWRLKSITAGGRDLLDLPLDFAGSEDLRDVVIVLTQQTSDLTGTVTDLDDRPVSGVSVLVFAEDRRRLPGRARWVRPDTLGHFAVDGLPAGDYLVALAEVVDDRQWSTPAFLEHYRGQAMHVMLADRGSQAIALRWGAAP
jgi:hypothetical protein